LDHVLASAQMGIPDFPHHAELRMLLPGFFDLTF
jgi:hypothetical protein